VPSLKKNEKKNPTIINNTYKLFDRNCGTFGAGETPLPLLSTKPVNFPKENK